MMTPNCQIRSGGTQMAELQLRDLTPAFGTEITGLDPQDALTDPATQQQLQALFDTRGVLVFRDLEVDQVQQADIIRMLIGLGPLAPGESPTGRDGGGEFYVSNKEENGGAPFGRLLFHSDMMWSEHTFRVLSLYGVEVEQPASPTIFVSATDGWATLPEDLRTEVGSRAAVQGHDEAGRADDPDVLVSTFKDLPTRTTPVALPHPHTGDTVLYVSQQMTQSIEGLGHGDSEALLEQLFSHLYRDEAVYEHDWRERDLVAWDNIAVQHARPNVSLEGPIRTLRKVYAPVPPKGANPTRPTYAAAG
jgi:alpha-ketoglutarate-dependent taurine dioxygenase